MTNKKFRPLADKEFRPLLSKAADAGRASDAASAFMQFCIDYDVLSRCDGDQIKALLAAFMSGYRYG